MSMKPNLPADDILRDNEAHCRGDVTTTLPTRRLRALGTTGKRQPSVVIASRWRLARSMLTGFMRRPGVALALTSVWLGIMWMAATKPLNAPDEPAHLQAIMQVRKEGILPEIHFDPGNPVSEIVGTPGDQASRDYAVSLGRSDPNILIPYESSQPPLFYLAACTLGRLFPPDPQTMLFVGRLVSVLFGAGVVYFCWAATRQLAHRAPMWAVAVAAVVALLP